MKRECVYFFKRYRIVMSVSYFFVKLLNEMSRFFKGNFEGRVYLKILVKDK